MAINMSFQSIQTDHRIGVWAGKTEGAFAEPHYHELFDAETVAQGINRLKTCATLNGWALSTGEIAVMVAQAQAARGGEGQDVETGRGHI